MYLMIIPPPLIDRPPHPRTPSGTLKLAQNSRENTARPFYSPPSWAAAVGRRPGGSCEGGLEASRASFERV